MWKSFCFNETETSLLGFSSHNQMRNALLATQLRQQMRVGIEEKLQKNSFSLESLRFQHSIERKRFWR